MRETNKNENRITIIKQHLIDGHVVNEKKEEKLIIEDIEPKLIEKIKQIIQHINNMNEENKLKNTIWDLLKEKVIKKEKLTSNFLDMCINALSSGKGLNQKEIQKSKKTYKPKKNNKSKNQI